MLVQIAVPKWKTKEYARFKQSPSAPGPFCDYWLLDTLNNSQKFSDVIFSVSMLRSVATRKRNWRFETFSETFCEWCVINNSTDFGSGWSEMCCNLCNTEKKIIWWSAPVRTRNRKACFQKEKIKDCSEMKRWWYWPSGRAGGRWGRPTRGRFLASSACSA